MVAGARQEAAMPGVLFLPDLAYDHRIWAELPDSLGPDCDAVCFDAHEPMPWEEPDGRAFLAAVRRLVPDPGRTVVAAAGFAAGLAVQAAWSGLVGGLVLFQPSPDRMPPEAAIDVPLEDALAAAAPWADILDAAAETDAALRTELVTGTLRAVYSGQLAAPDVELACQVVAGHIDELLATATGTPPPQAALPWVDRLAEISVPVTVVSARRASPVARAIAGLAPDGRFVAAAADTDLVWLEDRPRARAAIKDTLGRLGAQ
jgi:hypothetical protein